MSKNLLYYASFGDKNKNLFITASAILSAKKFKNDSFDILLYCDVNFFDSLNKIFPGILKEFVYGNPIALIPLNWMKQVGLGMIYSIGSILENIRTSYISIQIL